MTNALAAQPLPVPSALRPWIAGIGDVVVDRAPQDAFTHVPDTATKVVVRVEANGRADTLVVGPRTRATYHADPDRPLVSCVQLRLAPGAVGPLLGVRAVDLVGRAVPAGDLPSPAAGRLARELTGAEPEEITARLADLLPPPTEGGRARLLRAAVDALSTRPDRTPAAVREVARELTVSERQLRNLFADGVGVSPKHYARIDRVRHVLTHAASAPWAELAAATGYYDQSHMTADFRTLMGVPPRAFFTGRLPRATPCQASHQH
ncbi:AraC family transcriptional regulator [Streptomyces sp. NY05-11A]|uniref:AraC family transcriptional regulator n=1 Tax=Streptomyces soliscabiei TaxID=588897 RepID=UPI0029AFDF94|nr:helix-turn-helix domain-containing protein [Streptomyces sp. NY05-11A]MDX2681387.1 helix-turn-helix domain-containing protein [Streptomyces sp. NY05-11A]